MRLASLCFLLCAAGCGGGEGDAPCAGLAPGELVITEVFANPASTDTAHEWFEIYNAGTGPASLGELTLVAGRADGTSANQHRMRDVTVAAGSYLVVGGVLDEFRPDHVDYGYASDLGALRNSDGAIMLVCGDVVIDRVSYASAPDGASLSLDGVRPPDATDNDDDTRWCEGTSMLVPDALGTPGMANDSCGGAARPPGQCEGEGGALRDVVTPRVGDIVISEYLPNPEGADTGKEWIELYVTRDVDLNGLVLGTEAGPKDVLDDARCLRVEADSHVVLAQSADPAMNAGLPPPLALFDFALTNGASASAPERRITLGIGGVTLDEVSYTSSTSGAARAVDPAALDPTGNDDEPAWCDARLSYGTGDNKGTPGQANPSCDAAAPCLDGGIQRSSVPPTAGDLVITEIMANPSGSDSSREWFEILVTRDVDLNDVELGTEAGVKTTLDDSPDCLRAQAGSYLVFARSADSGSNGGLPAPDFLFTFGLTNSGERKLTVGHTGIVLDEIPFGDVGVPVQDGASSMLSGTPDPGTNEDPALWCIADVSYGEGGAGTPGASNSCP